MDDFEERCGVLVRKDRVSKGARIVSFLAGLMLASVSIWWLINVNRDAHIAISIIYVIFWIGALLLSAGIGVVSVMGTERTVAFDKTRRQFFETYERRIGPTTTKSWSFDDIDTIEVTQDKWAEENPWRVVVWFRGHKRWFLVRRTGSQLVANATIARLRAYLEPA